MADDTLQAVTAMAAALLRREDLDEAHLRDVAGRLDTIVGRLRTLDERALTDVGPAFAYQVTNAAYSQPQQTPPDYIAHLGGAGVTGYSSALASGDSTADSSAGQTTPTARTVPEVVADDELADLSLAEQAAMVRRGDISSEELVGRAIRQAEALNGRLNAFVTFTAEQALERARAADRRQAAGEPLPPLHGVPIALKDLYHTAGVPTTAGSAILAQFVPERDGTAVRLMQEAGAISIGKASTHQFAFGPTTESTHIGPCHNPWDIGRSPGGSSGGSAALVSARVVACALGSDTGGSIRIPAAACGIVGFKPTFGRASRAGVIPLSWSLDTVGPLAARVEDAALAVAALAGPDPLDQTTVDVPIGDYVAAAQRGRNEGAHGLRVGLLAAWIPDRVDPGVQAAVASAAGALDAAGAEVSEADLPDPGPMALVNRLISICEAAAYHAPLLERYANLYLPDVRSRLELGQFILARDYLLAQRLRTEMARRINALLERFDLLLAPTIPIGAPRIGQASVTWPSGSEPAPESMIRFTAPFNLSGHPVCAVPVGRSSEGMPASVQLVGRHFAEETVLHAAAALEQVVSPR